MRIEHHGKTSVLTFDRAPMNALDADALAQLDALMDELERAPPEGGLVLTGANDVFSAGVDVKFARSATPDDIRRIVLGLNRLCARLYGLQTATVAAVNGHAIGAGLIFALACDWRIGALGRGKLGLPEISAGLPYPDGPWAIVEAEIAEHHRRRLVFDGGSIGPEAALGLGLIDAVADYDMLVDRAIGRAKQMAAFPAFLSTKKRLKGELSAKLFAIAASERDTLLDTGVAF